MNDYMIHLLGKMKQLPERVGLGKLWTRLPANATLKCLLAEGCRAYYNLSNARNRHVARQNIPPEMLVDIWMSSRGQPHLGDID